MFIQNGNFICSIELTIFMLLSVVVVVTQSLPRDGDMAKDHGPPAAGKLSRAWSRSRKETESPKKEQCKESIAGQCRMR